MLRAYLIWGFQNAKHLQQTCARGVLAFEGCTKGEGGFFGRTHAVLCPLIMARVRHAAFREGAVRGGAHTEDVNPSDV